MISWFSRRGAEAQRLPACGARVETVKRNSPLSNSNSRLQLKFRLFGVFSGRDGAGAQPRIRRGDESPDGDLALPCPRRAQASPGFAGATSPTLRVSSPRRSRMRPSPHTNGHESLQLALRYLATSCAFTIATPRSALLQWLRATIPLPSSLFPLPSFPIREACEAGVFVSGEGRIRDAGIRRRPKVEKAQRRMAKAVRRGCEKGGEGWE